jgi:hypothetical protein
MPTEIQYYLSTYIHILRNDAQELTPLKTELKITQTASENIFVHAEVWSRICRTNHGHISQLGLSDAVIYDNIFYKTSHKNFPKLNLAAWMSWWHASIPFQGPAVQIWASPKILNTTC